MISGRSMRSNSNAMAALLAGKLKQIHGVKITQEVQSNGVFVIMPLKWLKR